MKKNRKALKEYICVNCRDSSTDPKFRYEHNCKNVQIVEKKNFPMPSRPKLVNYFIVEFNENIYKFKDYSSSMLFRRMLWIEERPIKEVLLCSSLIWYDDENDKKS